MPRRTALLTSAAAVAALLLVPLGAASTAAADPPQRARWTAADLDRLGAPQFTKRVPSDAVVAGRAPAAVPNPYLTEGPGVGPADYYYWNQLLDRRSERRAAQRARADAAVRAAVPVIDEAEPPAVLGANDTPETGQPLAGAGTGSGEDREVRVLGTLASPPGGAPRSVGPFAEDDGAIPLANDSTLTASGQRVRVTGRIGDGPHARAGSGSGDFDVFAVEGATAGQVLTLDVDAFSLTNLYDAFVGVASSSGAILAVNDDEVTTPDSFLELELPADDDYYVFLTAFGSLPTNPFDSGSGTGARSEGTYALEMSLDVPVDVDVYSVDLAAGDVVSSSVSGAARRVALLDPTGATVVASQQDRSVSYPEDTRLLGGGNAVLDHVAATSGRHSLVVARGTGDYEARLRLLRPPLEEAPAGARQVLFLDLDGAELNTSIFGGDLAAPGGVRTLSPMTGFLGGCGIRTDQVDAVIDGVVANVRENFELRSAHPGMQLEVRNSRDHADPWGQPNVSRIIVGGTRAELGNPNARFNGIAQSIDPGNQDREETGVVLLDHICAPAGTVPISANDFVGPGTDRVRWIASGLGFVVSHEAGHYFGSWHTENESGVTSIMDQFDLTQLGIGPDGFGGTADDIDVDFVADRFNPDERFEGLEDTAVRGAYGLSTSAADVVAPTAVTAVVQGRDVVVRWSAAEGDVRGYVVRAVRAGSGTVTSRTVDATASRTRLRDLRPGSYEVSVAALVAGGEGPAVSAGTVRVRR